MSSSPFIVIASLVRDRRWPFARWAVEVTDPASPVAGVSAIGRTPGEARRALAVSVAAALVDDRFEPLPDEVDVEIVTWQRATYAVVLDELAS